MSKNSNLTSKSAKSGMSSSPSGALGAHFPQQNPKQQQQQQHPPKKHPVNKQQLQKAHWNHPEEKAMMVSANSSPN